MLEFLNLIINCSTTNEIRISFFMQMSNLDEKQQGLVNQFLQIFSERLPKTRSSLYLSDLWHFPDMDNQMWPILKLRFKAESDIPVRMKFLASSRADGQQLVTYIHLGVEEDRLAQKILDAIKKV